MRCTVCGGEMVAGRVGHYRCRNCGAQIRPPAHYVDEEEDAGRGLGFIEVFEFAVIMAIIVFFVVAGADGEEAEEINAVFSLLGLA